MKKHFYTHLIEIETLTVELGQMDLSQEEKLHLAKLIDSTMHHTILDAVMSELSEEDKQVFMQYLSDGNHDKVWEHLKGKIENIEDKIKKTAEDLKVELHKDIKEAKEKRP